MENPQTPIGDPATEPPIDEHDVAPVSFSDDEHDDQGHPLWNTMLG